MMMRLMTPTTASLVRPSAIGSMSPQMSLLTHSSYFGFASRMKEKRIYVDKSKMHLPGSTGGANLDFKKPWESKAHLLDIKVTSIKKRATVTRQPTPIHDYINFKQMSGNEILINLNNVKNLGQQEMMAGLLELSRRDKKGKHDWNVNPITARCVSVYTAKVEGYNSTRLLQGLLMLS